LVKQFTYRGLSQKELEELPLEKLLKLYPARTRRSLTRGINDGKRKLIEEIKATIAGKLKTAIKTHLRDLLVLPYMVGVTVIVFSGKEFVPVTITTEMVGHYLGEYVITNKRVSHGAPGVGASRSSLKMVFAHSLKSAVMSSSGVALTTFVSLPSSRCGTLLHTSSSKRSSSALSVPSDM